MKDYYADLHIHVGRSEGRPVKITASRDLTVEGVITEAAEKKGMDVIGLIDAVCPPVQRELTTLLDRGDLCEDSGGGLRYTNDKSGRQTLILLGGEIEIAGPVGGAAHFGAWFPTMAHITSFTDWLNHVTTNVNLSSQRANCDASTLQNHVCEQGGFLVVNHAFTPHKGLYGNCVAHLADMVDPSRVGAIELGLSADSKMADRFSELSELSFVSNSDAHSLPKIAREYNTLLLHRPNFEEVLKALRRQDGRRVSGNYGLEPRLGKYHLTHCAYCNIPARMGERECRQCGRKSIVTGVSDRINAIADLDVPNHPAHRPTYVAQIPLQFVPGIGPKMLDRLLNEFGTEMNILHRVTFEQLCDVIGESIASMIVRARSGDLTIDAGGGGKYGKVRSKSQS